MSLIKIDGKNESTRIIHRDTVHLDKRLADDTEQLEARRQELDKTAPDENYRGSDASLPANQQHDYDPSALARKKNFDQKIYLFPPEFNALREELETNYPVFFTSVNPELGYSPAWAMIHNAPNFIGMLNGACDTDVQLDTENVSGTCKIFLNRLRALRGVSPL